MTKRQSLASGRARSESSSRRIRLRQPTDLARTLRPFWHGPQDPTIRHSIGIWAKAWRTPDGPASIALMEKGDEIEAEAWGPGSSWILDQTPELVGVSDDVSSFNPGHPVVRELHRRYAGLRICRSRRVLEALMPSIIEQKVTTVEAHGAWKRMVLAYGEPAPGPLALWVSPDPAVIASLPYWQLHKIGLEKRRADTLRRACLRASRLEECSDLPHADARSRLETIVGVGRWTSAEVATAALGDPDAVSEGDCHLPNTVAWVLEREERADDRRMLELLEPFRGQRGRVCRLIEATGARAPRRGPRMQVRDLQKM